MCSVNSVTNINATTFLSFSDYFFRGAVTSHLDIIFTSPINWRDRLASHAFVGIVRDRSAWESTRQHRIELGASFFAPTAWPGGAAVGFDSCPRWEPFRTDAPRFVLRNFVIQALFTLRNQRARTNRPRRGIKKRKKKLIVCDFQRLIVRHGYFQRTRRSKGWKKKKKTCECTFPQSRHPLSSRHITFCCTRAL